jgi:large subunit ribosomal protein L18e
MAKSTKTNPNLEELIRDLKKNSWDNKAPFWRDIAKRFEKPLKNWSEVNISSIRRNVKTNETIIIPGKLLGTGDIDFPVTVAAFSASKTAEAKITKAGGKILTIRELLAVNPKGKNIRIIG